MLMDLASIQEIVNETEIKESATELYQSFGNFNFSNNRVAQPELVRAQSTEFQTLSPNKKPMSKSPENESLAHRKVSKTVKNFISVASGLEPFDETPKSPPKPAPTRKIDLNVFQKLESTRDPAERAFCLETLKNFNFFTKSYEDMVNEAKKTVITKSFDEYITECSKLLQFRKFSKGGLVFHKGDVGSKMYLILDGLASVFVPKSYDEQEADQKILDSIMRGLKFKPDYKPFTREEALKKIKPRIFNTTYENLETNFVFDEYISTIICKPYDFKNIQDHDF
jgi:hypothetical protein